MNDDLNSTKRDLCFFDNYQCKAITVDVAEKIKNIQATIISASFIQGFASIGKSNSPDSYQLEKDLAGYLFKVDKGYFLQHPEMFSKEQWQIYHLVHESNLHYTEQIFFEYLIGLCRFVLSIQLLYEYLKFISHTEWLNSLEPFHLQLFSRAEEYSVQDFFNRLVIVSDIGKKLIEYLSGYYFQDQHGIEKYWIEVEKYFLKFPSLDALAKNLVSIQYVPKNKRYLSIMQVIHWQGFGGSGCTMLHFERLKCLVTHAIAHHNNYSTDLVCNRRLMAFKLPLELLVERAQHLIVNYLNIHLSKELIYIHDFCSGPKFNAVKAIIESEKNTKFHLSVSDIDGSSLISLIHEKSNNNYKNLYSYEVFYVDLSLPLQLNKYEKDKYHLVNINLGLHQIPLEEIYTAIRYFAAITKIGGLIANLDASERRYLQLMLIPGNVVDREGYVPTLEDMDLSQLIIPSEYENYIRIAYPLLSMANEACKDLDPEIGIGPYMVSFYSPLFVKKKDVPLLLGLWSLRKFLDCDKLVHHTIENL